MTKTEQLLELSCPYANQYQGPRRRMLFVCSAGMLRSPTAAAVATSLGHNARSCGTGNYALIQLSANLIYWAERIIFVNEENYYAAVELIQDHEDLRMEMADKHEVWDIEDIFNYMDPELVKIVTDKLRK